MYAISVYAWELLQKCEANLIDQREHEALTAASENLQALRTSFAQQSQTIARLETRNGELNRQLALVSAQESVAKATLRSAENKTKALKEELTRLRGTVSQIRGQCAIDLRRRDGEIQKLKRSIEGRRGRDDNNAQTGAVVVKPGSYKAKQESVLVETEVDIESPDYSLKQETTEFLTQLIHGLSDENDALIALVKSTLQTLRNLQGLQIDSSSGQEQSGNSGTGPGSGVSAAPPSYEELAADTGEVLDHLRGLLTNPSFVPLEEVEVREEEIIRLREGWEKMEARWKEAIALMDGWRKRMVHMGDTINLEDLRIGLNLGSEIVPSFPLDTSAPQDDPVGEESSLNSQISDCAHKDDNDKAMEESSGILDDLSADELDLLNTAPSPRVLKSKSPNARPKIPPRKPTFSPILEENMRQLRDAEDGIIPFGFSPVSPTRKPSPSIHKTSTIKQQVRDKSKNDPLPPLFYFGSVYIHPNTDTNLQNQKQSPLRPSPRTVAQKLALAQAEAEEVRKREESKPAKPPPPPSSKNKKLKRGSRRRSTLSPEELENLLDCL